MTVGAIALWASGVLAIGITAVVYLLLAMLLAVQPAAVVFSGFHSGALWLVFAGLVIAVAVQFTGLGTRIARSLTVRIGGSYLALLSGIAIAATTLNFLMPSSMGRILILTPIVVAIADHYGFAAGRAGRIGMIMVVTAVSFVPSGAVMTALVPNLVMVGAADNLYGVSMNYGGYLLTHFPVMGALRTFAIVLLARILFPDIPGSSPVSQDPAPYSRQEIWLATILGLALALWITDAVHGVAAAWVGLGAAAIVLLPGLKLVPTNTLNEKLDYNSFFYVAGVLSMGAVISGSGLAGQVSGWLTGILPLSPAADGANVYWLTLFAAMLGPLVTNPAVPAVLSPLSGEFAELTGLSLDVVLMTQVAGFSNVVFPYQASPILVGMSLGGVGLRAGTKLLVALTLVTLLILLPLNFLWWRAIGLVGT